MSNLKTMKSKVPFGFYISMFGTVLILLWLGIFKFTPTEAEAIKPLVINHPFTSWMYNVFSVQTISNMIGVFEIIVAILIIIGLKNKRIAKLASIGLIVIFLMTLSYLITTPDTWKTVDGILITKFSLIKDIMYLGFGITLFQYSNQN